MNQLDDLSLTETSSGILMDASKLRSIEAIREKLKPYYTCLVTVYEGNLLDFDEDYRSGKETYGYDDLESIQYSLSYISDRWKCAFRVRWLIELINPEYQLWDGRNVK